MYNMNIENPDPAEISILTPERFQSRPRKDGQDLFHASTRLLCQNSHNDSIKKNAVKIHIVLA